MARPLPLGARVALGVVAAATAFAVLAYQDQVGGRAAVGRPAPAFALPDLQGRIWSLAALRGRVVVLNFWASWCTVCAAEDPALEAFAQRFQGRVVLLGVDWREPASVAQAYARAHGLTYPILRDAEGTVAARYGLTGVPETWVVAPDGVLRFHLVGAVTFDELLEDAQAASGGALLGRGVGPVPAGGRAEALALWGGRLWVGTDRGLWSSADGGRTWRRAPGPLGQGPVRFLVASDGTLWAGGPAVGLWEASGAAAFRPAEAGLPGAPAAFAAAGARRWAWVPGHGLWAQAGAAPWRPEPAPPAPPVALAAAGDDLWAATPAGVFRRVGRGPWEPAPLWQPLPPTVALQAPEAIAIGHAPLEALGMVAAGGAVYLAGPDGVWSSAAPGGPLPGSPARALVALAVGPNGTLWALAPDGDLYRRLPSGAWVYTPYPLSTP